MMKQNKKKLLLNTSFSSLVDNNPPIARVNSKGQVLGIKRKCKKMSIPFTRKEIRAGVDTQSYVKEYTLLNGLLECPILLNGKVIII